MNFREMRMNGRSVWIQTDKETKKTLFSGYRIETVGEKYLLKKSRREIQLYKSLMGAINAAIEIEKDNI
jgi:hypothetical protein